MRSALPLVFATALRVPRSAVAAEPPESDHSGAWSFLTTTLPNPLSDMGIAVFGDAKGVPERFVLTGGCDSPEGNQYTDFDGVGFFECSSLSTKVYAFVPTHNKPLQAWSGEFTALAQMPRARYRHASAVANGKLCLFGGRDVNDVLIPEVDCYDPLVDLWSTPTVIPAEHVSSDLGIFVTEGDRVHLVGGFDAQYNALDQVLIVDMSDFDSVSFASGPGLSKKRGDINVAIADDGRAYVAGGYTHENSYTVPLASVETYGVATGSWSEIAPLNEERGDSQLVAAKDKIYAMGGDTRLEDLDTNTTASLIDRVRVLRSVEVLELGGDIDGGPASWKTSSSLPQRLHRFAAFGWDGGEDDEAVIFAFGGQMAYKPSCQCFPSTDKVMVFGEENGKGEDAAPASAEDGAATAASPGSVPSASPTRALVGATDAPPGAGSSGAHPKGEETSPEPSGGDEDDVASNRAASDAPSPSPFGDGAVGTGGGPSSPVPSLAPVAPSASAAPDDAPSAAAANDDAAPDEPLYFSGGSLANSLAGAVPFVSLVGLMPGLCLGCF